MLDRYWRDMIWLDAEVDTLYDKRISLIDP
jgi:hypothetical protein